MKDWLNMVGTICSIASAVIAIWHACKAKKYREEIYKRAKVIFQNMVLEHLKTIQKTIRDIEDARLDNKVLRGKDSIGIINRNFDEIFGKIYNESEDVYIKLRVELLGTYGETLLFIMSFHFAEKAFTEEMFPYKKK